MEPVSVNAATNGMPRRKSEYPAVQAVLLDRDGVINRERSDYVKCWQEWELLPGVLAALARLALLQVPILVISNQSAIRRGIVSRATVDHIHRRLQRLVARHGGRIDAFYVCPHRPDEGCACRKPRPGLLFQAAHDFNLGLTQCFFVGDSLTDYQAAQAAGCQSILVTSGKQGPQLHSGLPCSDNTLIVPDLAAAVTVIMRTRLVEK